MVDHEPASGLYTSAEARVALLLPIPPAARTRKTGAVVVAAMH